MTERQSSWDPKNVNARGIPPKEMINLYKRWGEGGFGVILTGNTMVELDQLEAPGNLIIPSDSPLSGERFAAFKALATEAKRHGSLIISQVSHPGRQVNELIQKHPISASDVQLEVHCPLSTKSHAKTNLSSLASATPLPNLALPRSPTSTT
jgi:2,4-dienoyl-CoA reductase-like NADH-dependent reductase (Old Yellow Enzyme family)